MADHPLYKPINVAAVITCVVAVRIALMYQSGLELFFDEAQYWTWAKDPALGYFSKPPMVAWLIALTTGVCGDTPFCVRLSAPILHGLTAFVVYFAGWELYNRRTGCWAALVYLTLPGVAVSSYFISADVPLMLFWALCFLCFAKALDGDGDKWWILAGVAAGFGMQSKYTIAVFFISAAIYMVFQKGHRKYLIGAPFILSALVALFIFFPNFLWNLGNNFVSFSHTNENVVGFSHSLYPMKLLEFFAAQFAVFGPVTFGAMLFSLRAFPHYFKGKEGKLLIIFTFTLLMIACGIALTSGAQAHWAAPAYITGSILVAHYLLHLGGMRWLKIALGLHIALSLLFFAVDPVGKALDKSPFERLYRWNGLAIPASSALVKNEGAVLVSDERKIVATLMYRLRTKEGLPYPVMKWNPQHKVQDHYDLSTDLNLYRGLNVIFITRNPNIIAVAPYFSAAEKLSDLVISGKPFYLFRLTGFKGY